MENLKPRNVPLLSLKKYYIYLQECHKTWMEVSNLARGKERDLLALSDQLGCLSGDNKTALSSLELQKTSDRIFIMLEEKYSLLVTAVEKAINTQDELTNLRLTAEMYYESAAKNDLIRILLRSVYVSWLFFQTRSSSVGVALKSVNYKSPESIKHLLHCLSDSDNFREQLTETLQKAEIWIRFLES